MPALILYTAISAFIWSELVDTLFNSISTFPLGGATKEYQEPLPCGLQVPPQPAADAEGSFNAVAQ